MTVEMESGNFITYYASHFFLTYYAPFLLKIMLDEKYCGSAWGEICKSHAQAFMVINCKLCFVQVPYKKMPK